jgi:flagellar hook-basal body complex protein FliE
VTVNAIQRVQSTIPAAGGESLGAPQVGGPSFADELGRALGAADTAQLAADSQATRAALGAGNIHETAIALEKADISMRVLTKVRNKLVEAYQEVMRMSV